jgi:hypothetical protein
VTCMDLSPEIDALRFSFSEHCITILSAGSNDSVFTFLTCGKERKKQKRSEISLGGFVVAHGFRRCFGYIPCTSFPWSLPGISTLVLKLY